MKTFFVILLISFFSLSLQAQFGINGKYLATSQSWKASGEPALGEPIDLFDNGWSAGIDYWFRLKNKRIEFLPELNYTSLSKTFPNTLSSEASIYSFFFNTNFYLWDMNGDCDCPTFSKQGPTLEKGLFLQLSPGVSYWDIDYGSEGLAVIKDQVLAFSIGAGIGFDLGLTDLVTLTPMANVRYFPKVNPKSELTLTDENGDPIAEAVSISASPLFFSAGLRLGIRLDQ